MKTLRLDTRLISVFFMGFSSGLPFLLILSTLSIWLAEIGISKTIIGLLAWTSVPYSMKFIWGILIDKIKLPFLQTYFGLRRSWLLLTQILLLITLIALGNTDPRQNLTLTAMFAFFVGLCSAIQDIAIEAYRIEILPSDKIGAGASITVLGYRLGMLCSGAGTIFLAAYFASWKLAYVCSAFCMLLGILTTLLSPEPLLKRSSFNTSLLQSLRGLMQQHSWQIIIPFILSYKIADTVLNVMSMPFLVEIGFTNLEIAYVAKTFGICAMILGGILGGILLAKRSMRYTLLMSVVLQFIASCLFIAQAKLGHNVLFLFFSMGIENLVCGLSQVALIAYLSKLSSSHNTAMHYALLSSFASFVRVSFSALAGWLADHYAWPQFYSLVCLSCLPSALLIILCAKHFINLSSTIVVKQSPDLIPGEI